MSRFRIPLPLGPWGRCAILASLILFAHAYGWITGGNVLQLFFEPIVKPPVWKPLDPENYPSVNPEFRRGLQAYNENQLSEAFQIWLPLAHSDDPNAQYLIGRMLARGWGVEKDYELAVNWYGKASALGHAKSTRRLIPFGPVFPDVVLGFDDASMFA